MKSDLFKRYKFVLTTLSPVHIGSEEGNTNLDWYEKVGGEIRRLTEESYVIKKFSNIRKPPVYLYSLEDETGGLELNRGKPTTVYREVKPIIRHPDGRIYFPASSLKGAIRIALIHLYFEKNESMRKFFNERVEKAIQDVYREAQRKAQRSGKKRPDRKLTKYGGLSKMLEGVLRQNAPKYDGKDNSMLYDVMKFLKISDSSLSNELAGMYYTSILKRNGESGKLSLIEAIRPGTSFEFDVTVDVKALYKTADGRFVKRDPDEFMNLIKEALDVHIKPVKESEKAFTRHMDPRRMEFILNSSNMKIGWGSGLLATTVFDLLDEDTRKKVMKLINSKFESSEPVTRKATFKWNYMFRRYEPQYPLGWAKLSVERL